jgi:hypothetical protein
LQDLVHALGAESAFDEVTEGDGADEGRQTRILSLFLSRLSVACIVLAFYSVHEARSRASLAKMFIDMMAQTKGNNRDAFADQFVATCFELCGGADLICCNRCAARHVHVGHGPRIIAASIVRTTSNSFTLSLSVFLPLRLYGAHCQSEAATLATTS